MVVGITGGIGSGKSFICKILNKLEYPVFNADEEAKRCYFKPTVKKQVEAYFGSEAYSNGKLNRNYLSNQVFDNPHALEKLNSIIHPTVAKHFEKWKNEQDSDILFKEAAILFESGSYKSCDKTVLISCSKDIRIDRVIKRDNIIKKEVIARMNNQLSDEEKRKLCDFEIVNDGRMLLEQVDELLNYLK